MIRKPSLEERLDIQPGGPWGPLTAEQRDAWAGRYDAALPGLLLRYVMESTDEELEAAASGTTAGGAKAAATERARDVDDADRDLEKAMRVVAKLKGYSDDDLRRWRAAELGLFGLRSAVPTRRARRTTGPEADVLMHLARVELKRRLTKTQADLVVGGRNAENSREKLRDDFPAYWEAWAAFVGFRGDGAWSKYRRVSAAAKSARWEVGAAIVEWLGSMAAVESAPP